MTMVRPRMRALVMITWASVLASRMTPRRFVPEAASSAVIATSAVPESMVRPATVIFLAFRETGTPGTMRSPSTASVLLDVMLMLVASEKLERHGRVVAGDADDAAADGDVRVAGLVDDDRSRREGGDERRHRLRRRLGARRLGRRRRRGGLGGARPGTRGCGSRSSRSSRSPPLSRSTWSRRPWCSPALPRPGTGPNRSRPWPAPTRGGAGRRSRRLVRGLVGGLVCRLVCRLVWPPCLPPCRSRTTRTSRPGGPRMPASAGPTRRRGSSGRG